MNVSLRAKLSLGAALVAVSGTSVAVVAFVVTGSTVLTTITLAATIVTAGLLGEGARRLMWIVTELVEDIEAIADGELSRTVTTTRDDELGDMFRSLESLRADLARRIEAAETARREAEDKRQRAEEAEAELDSQIRTQQEEFERYAQQYSSLMTDCANGDLTVRLPTDSDSDVMADIATSFNAMMDDIEATVADIVSFTDQLQTANTIVLDEARELKATSEEVSDSVRDIATGASDQSGSIEEINDEITALSSSFEEVAAQTEEVAQRTQDAATTTKTVQDTATSAAADIETIRTESETTIEQVRDLTAEMDRVGEIVELIDGIAEQTNILALNASIEAARAGRDGESFAVVADEVKQLAERTRDATDDIEAVIRSVQSTTEQTATNMESMAEQVTRGHEAIDDVVTELDEVVDRITKANSGVQTISDATEDQATSAQEIVMAADEVSEISDETSIESEQLAGTIQEQTRNIIQVTKEVEQLDDQTASLERQLSRFNVQSATNRQDATGGNTVQASSPQGSD